MEEWSYGEAEVRRTPYSIKAWLRLLETVEGFKERRVVYERALRLVPRSYKLWVLYLEECEKAVGERWLTSRRAATTTAAYERALVHLNKMPGLWLRYLSLLQRRRQTHRTRIAFDACLQALPITQHDHVWPEFVTFAVNTGIVQLAQSVYSRYCMYDPSRREDLATYMLSTETKAADAARELAQCVQDEAFRSPSGKSKHQLWMKLIDVCAAVGDDCPVDVERSVRAGLMRFTDEVGLLWCKLAEFYIRSGRFESARDVYDEAASTVLTVRDFGVVFDAYAAFEESIVRATMREGENIDFGLARLERLVAKRPLLLSSVVLRQNPHNVREWLARSELYPDDLRHRLRTLAEGVKTVDPAVAVGKPEQLWIAMARAYGSDLDNARAVFDRAVGKKNWRTVDQVASLYCSWAEIELELGDAARALQVAQRGVLDPDSRAQKSPKLWSLYVDLQVSLGTFATAKAAYDRVLDLKIATPATILNLADFLRRRNRHDDAFRAYERGLAVFKWPHAREIWLTYLDHLQERYPKKLERTRDLFEKALASKPPDSDRARLFVAYARFEETRGSARKAIAVYERAAAQESRHPYGAYLLYARKVSKFFGAVKARPVYERAIKELDEDEDAKRMCLHLVDLETQLGEIDRARALLAHGAQFAPEDAAYWDAWRQFEVGHGNEDTFRDMLRIKRSVETAHNVLAYQARAQVPQQPEQLREPPPGVATRARPAESSTIRDLERLAQDVAATEPPAKKPRLADPNEIDLDDDDQEEGDPAAIPSEELQLERRPVPEAVFGDIDARRALQGEPVGALARFKQAATAK